jgi:hypothetical protein
MQVTCDLPDESCESGGGGGGGGGVEEVGPGQNGELARLAEAEGEGQAEGEEVVVEEEGGLAPGQLRRWSVAEVDARALSMFAEHRATPRAPAQTRAAAGVLAADWDSSDADVPDAEREGMSPQEEEYACLVSNHWLYNGVHI